MRDALGLCEKEQDNFYLDAFMIECWLGDAVLRVYEEYAGKKKAQHRQLQTGQTWRAFMAVFGHAKANEFNHVYLSLLRFAEYDDVESEMLRRTIVPLSFEHQCFSDYVRPNNLDIANRPVEAAAMLRRTLERWCEWLDALIHFRAHATWHLVPLQFDPDPEKRELAALGINQRFFGDMNEFSRKWWEWHHGQAAERFKNSPKWQTVGKAMSAQTDRVWNYPQLDEVLIWLWPLLKRNNWTYRDLMNVTRQIVSRPNAYPCQREQDFAAYCTNVLGLRKTGPGKTAKDGRPVGYEVALRLCERKPTPSS
jgi:hypothetical protein